MSDHCKRQLHSFNPAPNSVKRSDLLGVCDKCQAETVLEWHNRDRWNRGEIINAVHINGCPHRYTSIGYKKV